METEDLPEWVKEIRADEEKFWAETYANYSFDQKVSHWSGSLHRSMRWNGESGYDEYAIYSPEWHAAVLEIEPEIDRIMDEVFTRWRGTWSKAEYLKRIRGD